MNQEIRAAETGERIKKSQPAQLPYRLDGKEAEKAGSNQTNYQQGGE
jgi:hypothetical protein